MAIGRVNYAVIDAFTSVPFKGNPAAVCLLERGQIAVDAPDSWMKSVAAEFNISDTCFLTPNFEDPEKFVDSNEAKPPRFHLRWFTPVDEVNLCGHATLASAHYLFTSICEKYDELEFVTKSGILTAKKIFGLEFLNSSTSSTISKGSPFAIELTFPLISFIDFDSTATSLFPGTLSGALVVDLKKTAGDDLIVVLSSGLDVANIRPEFEEIREAPGRGVIITGPAPEGSGFDFYSRFFCPKLGVNEDPVCGSAHCSLAPYWAQKLGKKALIAYMASSRGGVLDLLLEEKAQRVRMRGEAVTVMTVLSRQYSRVPQSRSIADLFRLIDSLRQSKLWESFITIDGPEDPSDCTATIIPRIEKRNMLIT